MILPAESDFLIGTGVPNVNKFEHVREGWLSKVNKFEQVRELNRSEGGVPHVNKVEQGRELGLGLGALP